MSDSIQKTLTVTNGAYSIGDVVGGLITFDPIASEGRCLLVPSVKISGVAALAYNLWFLSADLATPALDNAAFAWAAADVAKYLGHVQILATHYLADQSAGFNSATVPSVGVIVPRTLSKIYAYLVATATTTPGTTTLKLTVDFVDM
jgi:hypothetical protein